MSYRIVQGDILSQQTDAVAISVEIDFSPSEMPCAARSGRCAFFRSGARQKPTPLRSPFPG